MKKKVNDNSSNDPQRGSAVMSGVVAIFAIGLATMYAQTMSDKTSKAIKISERDRIAEANYTGSISSISRFKALLSGGASTNYKPAVYANNYFDENWALKEMKTGGAVVDVVGAKVHLGSRDAGSNLEGFTKVFKGGTTSVKTADEPRIIETIKTNFDSSGLIAESVDVRITKAGFPPSAFRIFLPIPQPTGVKLELSPAGQNNFKDVKTVGPGAYDIRVLSSGIVYKATVQIGSKNYEVGGINRQSGKIEHPLVNPYVVDREIGRFTHTFVGGTQKASLDTTSCVMSYTGTGPSDVSIAVAVYGVDRLVAEGNQLATTIKVSGGGSSGQEFSDEVAAGSCQDQCHFYTDEDFEEGIGTQWAKGDFGDYSQVLINHEDRRRWNMMDKKLCMSPKRVAGLYKARFGAPLLHHYTLNDTNMQGDLDLVSYSLPSCKREFLFARSTCGCFAEETKILLGDQKTEKSIQDLTEHDRVWNPVSKTSMGIKRMTKGPEKFPMLEIRAGENTLNVTGDHPFPTREGILPAFKLNPGQAILDERGEWVSIHSIEADVKNRGKDVWNLELDGPREDLSHHYVLANGVITGDLYIQESLGK